MKKITEPILPPKEFNATESACWIFITGDMLSDDILFEEHLPEIQRLSKIEAERLDILDNIGVDLPRLFNQCPESNPKYYMLSDTDEFNKMYERFMDKLETYQAAYEATDFLHWLVYGKTKYSNYDSFRKTREQRIKREA